MSDPPGPPPVDVLVRTFNSARTLRECLAAARARLPIHRLIVVDRNSTDATGAIATEFGAEIHREDAGIGLATTRAIELSETPTILFLDSDVTIVRPDFYREAARQLERPRVGAVVGCTVGHPFQYGLPLGLTLLRREWAVRLHIPPAQQGAETWYLRRAMREDRLKVAYVPGAMVHTSLFRGRNWPEWQGANTRVAAGWSAYELVFSFLVIGMVLLNSRRWRNVAYTPVFWVKFLHGFARPKRWMDRDRRIARAD